MFDPAEIVDREVSHQIEAGAFVHRGDLHNRSFKLIKLEVSAAGLLAASTRVDLWRARSPSGEQFACVLSGVEIASAEVGSPAAPTGNRGPQSGTVAQTDSRPADKPNAAQQTGGKVATNSKANLQKGTTKTWTLYLKVPTDWTPTANDTAKSLFAIPVATDAEGTAARMIHGVLSKCTNRAGSAPDDALGRKSPK